MRPEEILLLGWAVVLPLSIAASQIMLALFAAAWLLRRRREVHRASRPTGAMIAIVLVFAGEWLACLVNGASSHLADPVRKHAVLLALPLLAVASSERPEIYRRAIGIAAAVAALVGIYAVWQHFTGVDLVRNRILEPRNLVFIATGMFNHHLTYGGSVMLAGMAAAGLAAGGRGWRGLPLFLGLPLGLGLLWSYARSAWCGAFVGLALILGVRRDRRALVLLAAGLAAVLLVLRLDVSLRERLKEGIRGNGTPPRVLLLQTSLRMFADHPLGIAPGRFAELFPQYRVEGRYLSTVHPHSDPVRALLDGGPLTLLGYLLLVPGTGLLAFRALRQEQAQGLRPLSAEGRWGLTDAASHLAAARHDLLLVSLGASGAFWVAGFFQTYFWDQEDVMLWLLLAAPVASGLDPLLRRGRDTAARVAARVRHLGGTPPAPPGVRRILVLCEGNLCRSPLAALLLARSLGGRGIVVESAGLRAAKGHPAPALAQEAAAELGISLAEHRSQPVDRAQAAAADWILVMDLDQRRRLLALAPEARGKVELFGRFLPERSASPEIADPMDRDLATFRRVYGQLATAVRQVEAQLRAV
jgi:protein-tyrosine phosphatase